MYLVICCVWNSRSVLWKRKYYLTLDKRKFCTMMPRSFYFAPDWRRTSESMFTASPCCRGFGFLCPASCQRAVCLCGHSPWPLCRVTERLWDRLFSFPPVCIVAHQQLLSPPSPSSHIGCWLMVTEPKPDVSRMSNTVITLKYFLF